MKTRLCGFACLVAMLMLAVGFSAEAGPYGGGATVDDMVAVSGVWTGVNWYKSDACWSGVGDPYVDDYEYHLPQDSNPINLSTSAGDAKASAASSIVVAAPSLHPHIEIHSSADVHDVPMNNAHWASAYSQGGANWLTSGTTQTITVTVDYSYALDLTQAHPASPYAYVKIYVAFWGPSSNLLLTPNSEWVLGGAFPNQYLAKTVWLWTPGKATGTVTGSMDWDVDVGNGTFYSFWSQADAQVWTGLGSVPVEPTTWGKVKALFR